MGDLRTVTERAQGFLAANFSTKLGDRPGLFFVDAGSTTVKVIISQAADQPDGPVWINVMAGLLFGASPTPELFKHTALHADDYRMEHLSAFENDEGLIDIWFTHDLLGDFLDEDELGFAVGGVAGRGDELDDELQRQFGGKRVADL
jgi:hypothetical protein